MEVPELRIAKAVVLQCIAANIGLDAECFHQLMRAAVLGSSYELAYVKPFNIYAETRPAYGVDNNDICMACICVVVRDVGREKFTLG